MLILNREQFQIFLPIFLMETRIQDSVPEVMNEYIIPNKALQQFIDDEMVLVWNNNVDWEKERTNIVDHLNWYSNTNYMNELEDWSTCYGVLSYDWETDNKVQVELEDEDMEEEFLHYVQNNFKHVEKDGNLSWTYDFEINSWEDEYGNNVRQLVYE